MKESDRYLKIVEWSEVDQKYIGSCPELFGGGCDGNDEVKVYKELCKIVDEWIEIYKQDGEPLPEPKLLKKYSGKFVMRVDPELHQALAIRAYRAKESLNNYCVGVLREDAAVYGVKSKSVTAKLPRGKPRPLPQLKYPLPQKRKKQS